MEECQESATLLGLSGLQVLIAIFITGEIQVSEYNNVAKIEKNNRGIGTNIDQGGVSDYFASAAVSLNVNKPINSG